MQGKADGPRHKSPSGMANHAWHLPVPWYIELTDSEDETGPSGPIHADESRRSHAWEDNGSEYIELMDSDEGRDLDVIGIVIDLTVD